MAAPLEVMSDAPTVRLDGAHTVLTPEYVEFNFVLAGLLSRLIALLIDTLISLLITAALLLIITAISAAASASLGQQAIEFGVAAAFVAWFVVDWGYMATLEVLWSGQTIGKRAMGLRVIQDTGVRVGPLQALLRNLVRPADKLPAFYLLGGLTAWASGSHQRLGDLLAGTIVVRERRLKIPAPLEREDSETTLLRDTDFLARVARLTAEEEALLFSATLRREELGIEARLNLFAALARRLEDELGFTKPEHLSDEKLVLLVSTSLAARKAVRRKNGSPGFAR